MTNKACKFSYTCEFSRQGCRGSPSLVDTGRLAEGGVMPKTCRVCAALGGYCEVTGRVFLGTIPAFIHIASRFTHPPGTMPEECPYWSKRETPLLVDRLAKMVRLLMSPVGEAITERAEAVDAANALLEEYNEEVGDA